MLAGHGRLLPDRAGRELNVLASDRRQHVGGGKVVGVQLVGIEPDAHGELGAELLGRADAGNALNLVEHLGGHDVVQLGGTGAVGGRGLHGYDTEKSRVRFGNADTLRIHLAREAWRRQSNPVLRLHSRDVGVGSRIEGQSDL